MVMTDTSEKFGPREPTLAAQPLALNRRIVGVSPPKPTVAGMYTTKPLDVRSR